MLGDVELRQESFRREGYKTLNPYSLAYDSTFRLIVDTYLVSKSAIHFKERTRNFLFLIER
jgi:hypothetical protein